jgi:hypothetical protein
MVGGGPGNILHGNHSARKSEGRKLTEEKKRTQRMMGISHRRTEGATEFRRMAMDRGQKYSDENVGEKLKQTSKQGRRIITCA